MVTYSFADNHNIYEILEQLNKDVKTLEKAVYSNSINMNNTNTIIMRKPDSHNNQPLNQSIDQWEHMNTHSNVCKQVFTFNASPTAFPPSGPIELFLRLCIFIVEMMVWCG